MCRPNEPCVRAFFLLGARHAFAVHVKITRAQVLTLGGCRRTGIDWTADAPPISKPLPPNTFVPLNQFGYFFSPSFHCDSVHPRTMEVKKKKGVGFVLLSLP